MKPDRVLIFEDRKEQTAKLSAGLSGVKSNATIEFYVPPTGMLAATAELLEKELTKDPPVGLVILDKDLTQFLSTSKTHVSSAEIKEVCNKLGIPICVYSKVHDEFKIEETKSWSEAQISLDSNQSLEHIAERSMFVYEGFRQLRLAFAEAMKLKKSFRETLRSILNPPEAALAQINQYSWGHVEVLAGIVERQKPHMDYVRVASTVAGYWIWNVLLRFPGVMLNEVAAASHLQIDAKGLQTDQALRDFLQPARYHGPFGNIREFWWLAALDLTVARKADELRIEPDAPKVFQRMGLKATPAHCAEKGHEGAGYYCILTHEAVCADHSVAPKGWLPLGADKSRIRKSKYDELAPWLGI